jgi:hypothetical protein
VARQAVQAEIDSIGQGHVSAANYVSFKFSNSNTSS